MKPTRRTRLPLCALAILICGGAAVAQTLPPPPPPPAATGAAAGTATDDEIVQLSAFQVTADADDRYDALNSNSITSFNAELGKLPISADIFTEAFMEDMLSVSLEQMLRDYAAGAGLGAAAGDTEGSSALLPMDRAGGDSVSSGIMLRGLGAAVIKQDNFMLPSPAGTGMSNKLGLERVEVINGPQALLYGNGGGGGVINYISKQARFNRKPSATIRFRINDRNQYSATLEQTLGNRRIALVTSILSEELGDYRLWIGGPLTGAYAQLALRASSRTVVRLTGKFTRFKRIVPADMSLQAGGVDADSRHGMSVRYLMTTNQMDIPTDPADPAAAGHILNNTVNWENLNSYYGATNSEERTALMASAIVETKWNRWLSTQLSAGWQDRDSRLYGRSGNLYAPESVSSANPSNLEEWVVQAGSSSTRFGWADQPAHSYSLRASALLTNTLFGGLARSQTSIAADYTEAHYANIGYDYYQSDANGNLRIQAATGYRMRAGIPWWSVSNGPVRDPLPYLRSGRYLDTFTTSSPSPDYPYAQIDICNAENVEPATPDNPRGLTTNPSNPGYGLWNLRTTSYNRGGYLLNYTQWGDTGRLTSLFGLRYMSVFNHQWPSRPAPALTAEGKNLSFSAGLNYDLNPWLRAYTLVSDTYNLPEMFINLVADPYGKPLPVSHSLGQEVGLKIGDDRRRVSGSVSFYELKAGDEPYYLLNEMMALINPDGVNGYVGEQRGRYIAVNKKSYGLQASIVAAPVKGWQTRLSAAFIRGTIGNDTRYNILYNDQFHVTEDGSLTYGAGGPVVHVREDTFSSAPGVAGQAGYVPLTVEKLSDPADLYYADPDPDNGRIRASGIRTLLQSDDGPGRIATGAVGLPMSEYQLTGVTPVAVATTSLRGERTTGYPEISFNLTNTYTIQRGPLKGLRLGVTIISEWQRNDLYHYENGYREDAPRVLSTRPALCRVNLLASYARRFGRLHWQSQLLITNLFDRQQMLVRPHVLWGYNERRPDGVSIRRNAYQTLDPRCITWTNTFKF
jgi:outer membrane receptor protein involved in Fe transport